MLSSSAIIRRAGQPQLIALQKALKEAMVLTGKAREVTVSFHATLCCLVWLVKLSSGAKKIFPSDCRAMIGQIAGDGRTKKPLLKVGNAYHKFRVKRNC
ncbi:hypothetical protein VNO77_20230 [Canavalia gladiata]|uniref:Large ribosomal subunit protein uL2 C-terminal domain-containing protein n=1 Tax=Canavalia gladiata TaxID=3824 RepID=A0AAN9LP87_CANGL